MLPGGRAPLLDREDALHAALAVAGHRAVEGVLARLEVDLDGRRAAVGDDLALLVDAVAVDGDVVLRGLIVDRLDRERAGRRLRVGELVREPDPDGDLQRSSLGPRGPLRAAADLREAAGVLARRGGRVGDVSGDVLRVLARDEV